MVFNATFNNISVNIVAVSFIWWRKNYLYKLVSHLLQLNMFFFSFKDINHNQKI